jgi:hypothetical protein
MPSKLTTFSDLPLPSDMHSRNGRSGQYAMSGMNQGTKRGPCRAKMQCHEVSCDLTRAGRVAPAQKGFRLQLSVCTMAWQGNKRRPSPGRGAVTKTRAQRIMTRLNNSKARQPLRTFEIADLVKVWRKVLPSDAYKGPRGGMKRTSRPGWIGPGRVVFTELLPHQDKDDPRRHIIWVLMHCKLFKCSVHSVWPVTAYTMMCTPNRTSPR